MLNQSSFDANNAVAQASAFAVETSSITDTDNKLDSTEIFDEGSMIWPGFL